MGLGEKQREDIRTAYGWLRSAYVLEEPVWWMARNRDTQEVAGSYVTGFEELLALAEHYDRVRWDLYLQLNPSRRRWGTRCTAEDITAWCFVPFDLDIVDKSKPADLDLATVRLENLVTGTFGLPLAVPHVVFSGRGQQVWYQIPRAELREGPAALRWPIPAGVPSFDDFTSADSAPQNNVEAPRAVRLAQRYWSGYFNRRLDVPNVAIDLSCVDLPRVMRCPGTVNTASGAAAAIIQRGTRAVGLRHAMLRYAPAEVFAPPPEPPPGLEGRPWQAYLPHLTRTAVDFLTGGAQEPGRHRACSATVKSLRDAGCAREEALRGVAWGASLCRPPLLDAAYLTRTVEAEYALRAT